MMDVVKYRNVYSRDNLSRRDFWLLKGKGVVSPLCRVAQALRGGSRISGKGVVCIYCGNDVGSLCFKFPMKMK